MGKKIIKSVWCPDCDGTGIDDDATTNPDDPFDCERCDGRATLFEDELTAEEKGK